MAQSRLIAAADLLTGGGWTALARKFASPASITGTVNETALATITIPANLLGLNGVLKVTGFWSCTNSVNNKTVRARLGGLAGTIFFSLVATTGNIIKSETVIGNRGSAASQFSDSEAARGSDGLVTTTTALGNVDTTANQDLVLSAQLANTGELITLEGYIIEVMK